MRAEFVFKSIHRLMNHIQSNSTTFVNIEGKSNICLGCKIRFKSIDSNKKRLGKVAETTSKTFFFVVFRSK